LLNKRGRFFHSRLGMDSGSRLKSRETAYS
jgi:hypothetical protein